MTWRLRGLSKQTLAHFDPEANLIIIVDASPNDLGVILSHLGSDGLEKTVCYASHSLTVAERN